MRRQIRLQQSELFSVPAAAPLALPIEVRAELIILLSAMLLEVVSYQQPELINTEKAPNHEQGHD